MAAPHYDDAVTYALKRLQTELPVTYTYHNLIHTRDDVLPAAVHLAMLSGCTPTQIELVRVAAAFHDLGFVEVRRQHELAGARLAAEVLPRFGFTPRAVEQIMGMIVATRLPQCPQTLMERILADADLDVLGREDFLERNAALHKEVNHHDGETEEVEWYQSQLAFLERHTYFTNAARSLRGAGEQANLQQLRHKLASVTA